MQEGLRVSALLAQRSSAPRKFRTEALQHPLGFPTRPPSGAHCSASPKFHPLIVKPLNFRWNAKGRGWLVGHITILGVEIQNWILFVTSRTESTLKGKNTGSEDF